VIQFTREYSEGGRRAQAIVAGLLDVFAGTERVESGRINDPSRHYPGDVCIRSTSDPQVWEKAFEVRDKPVSASDVQIFGKKCIDVGVREAAVVMVNEGQQALDRAALEAWAASFGIGLTLFHGWEAFTTTYCCQPRDRANPRALGRGRSVGGSRPIVGQAHIGKVIQHRVSRGSDERIGAK
jgi:hypothetical protein